MSPVRVSKMRRRWAMDNLLLILTFSGVICGVALGLGIRLLEPDATVILLLAYPGELFIRMLTVMILPLVIASLIAGSASLNAKANGRIVVRTVSYFLVTSLVNAILGIILAVAMHPGSNLTKQTLGIEMETPRNPASKVNILDGFLDLGRNIFPDNLIQASFQQVHTVYVENEEATFLNWSDIDNVEKVIPMVRKVEYRSGTNTLGIIVFCLVFGTILGSMGKEGDVVVRFFSTVDAVILKIVTGIMWLSPVGVASVIMSKILSVNDLFAVMSSLALFTITVVVGVMLWQIIFQNLIYFLAVRKNPFTFYFRLMEPWVTAFATASTAATLPITFRCMNDKCGVDPRISKFVLPIGATVNMDGTALFVSIGTVFIAQLNEIHLNFGEYVIIAVTATAASIASASVPSAALVLILIVLSAVNLPTSDVSLLFAIDWLLDRFRTTNNLLGDCYTAALVEKWSAKELQAMDETSSNFSPPETTEDIEKVEDETPLVLRTNKAILISSHANGTTSTTNVNGGEVRIDMGKNCDKISDF